MKRNMKRKLCVVFFFVFSYLSCEKRSLEGKVHPLSTILPKITCRGTKKYCLVMFGSRKCLKSVAFRTFFKESLYSLNSVDKKYVGDDTHQAKIKSYMTPLFVLYKEGHPIDIHVGTFHPKSTMAATFNKKIFEFFLSRNENSEKKRYLWDTKDHRKYYEKMKSLSHRNLTMLNLSGVNLKGKSMTYSILSGVSLKKANLEGVDLSHSIFSNVNLSKASLKNTTVKNNIWLNTICPDGTNSNKHSFSCPKG